ncbi:MAG: flagellar biosynthesis protein FlhF [Planctomycetaceae bacterium]|jgi:flagellar biosynthesis protein FlhF|nr:flagellar biosynthesis protein FlhF [Planctomycetaceae bacterium]
MDIKTFRAKTLQEGLRQIHEELGEDVKIMHTREVETSQLFGFRRQRFFEITVAENHDHNHHNNNLDKTLNKTLDNNLGNNLSKNLSNNYDNTTQQTQQTQQKTAKLLEQSLRTNSPETTLTFPVSAGEDSELGDSESGDSELRSELQSAVRSISNTDISKTSWQTVPLGVWNQLTPEQLNPTVLQRSLIALFTESVRFGGPIDLLDGKRKTVAFLGLSGVGKTTTIAKIAAHYRLKEFKRVGLVTIDTFRVAAAEQLGKYAAMLGIPMETVSEPFRMKTVLTRLEACDLILLDTPGINPKNTMKLQTLGAMLDAAKVDEVHLLFSATTHAAALNEMFHRFEPLNPTDLTFTKLDEAVGLTDLYQFLKTNILPIRFFSLGQNISEDIEVAGPTRLASLAN